MAENKEKYKYKVEIQQMMFVSGETNDPPAETTALVEDIVRSQVAELLLQAAIQASRRGSKSISTEDLIFLIRHDKAKVSRLRTYLSWKEVRKNAKDQDGGAVEGTDLIEDAAIANGEAPKMKYKGSRIKLSWETGNMFSEAPPEREDEEDEEEMEANQASLQRLKTADDRTRAMTREEYVHWSECRQASFTYRKGKRFRDWAGMSQLTDSKPNDEIIDILGFLTFEIVATLTEEALKVKQAQETAKGRRIGAAAAVVVAAKKRDYSSIFDAQDEAQNPITAKHIAEAFRRLQMISPKQRTLRIFRSGLVRTRPEMI